MPLDVETDYVKPYWQETWNLNFWVPSPKYLLVATKIEKILKVNPYSKAKLPKWVVAGWILLNSYCITVRF